MNPLSVDETALAEELLRGAFSVCELCNGRGLAPKVKVCSGCGGGGRILREEYVRAARYFGHHEKIAKATQLIGMRRLRSHVVARTSENIVQEEKRKTLSQMLFETSARGQILRERSLNHNTGDEVDALIYAVTQGQR